MNYEPSLKSVQVLMATFNGEAYVEEQVLSVLRQSGVQVNLLVYDDGSTDSTIEILSQISKYNANVEIILGPHLGYPQSYIEILKLRNPSTFYAFCDQDDVWLPNHLFSGLQALENSGRSAYACSRKWVNSELESVKSGDPNSPKIGTLRSAILGNTMYGNTTIIRSEIVHMILNAPPPFFFYLDAWINLVANVFGGAIYSRDKNVLYRRVETSVTGNRNYKEKLRQVSLNHFMVIHFFSNVQSHLKLEEEKTFNDYFEGTMSSSPSTRFCYALKVATNPGYGHKRIRYAALILLGWFRIRL